MKHVRFAALLLSLLFARAAAAASVPLIDLVGDDAAVVISVHDAPALVKNWNVTPWMKTWHDPQVEKYFAPLRAQLKVDDWDARCKASTGCTPGELAGFAQGEAVFALANFSTWLDAAEPSTPPPLFCAVELGANAGKVEKLLVDGTAKNKEMRDSPLQFEGVKVHCVESLAAANRKAEVVIAWAVADGVIYASPAKELLFKMLKAVKAGGADNALGRSDRFLRVSHRVGRTQLLVFYNLRAIYPAVQNLLVQRQALAAGRANPLGFDLTALLPALGLDAVNEIYLAASVGPDAAELSYGLTYDEQRGLTKLLAFGAGAPPQPAFVPEKCAGVSSVRFSLVKSYGGLEETLDRLSPIVSALFQGYVKKLDDQAGIDFKRDLLGSLGDQVVTVTQLNEAAPADAPLNARLNVLYAISVANVTALNNAIESIKHGMFGSGESAVFEKRNYLGHDLFTYAPPQPAAAEGEPARPAPRGFSYAVTDHWLFFAPGSAAPVKSALQGLAGKPSRYWNRPDVRRNLLAALPEDAHGFSYADLSKLVPLYFDLAAPAFAAGFANAQRVAAHDQVATRGDGSPTAANPNSSPVDAAAKPDAATLGKYWSYCRGYGWHDANGIYSTVRIGYPQNP